MTTFSRSRYTKLGEPPRSFVSVLQPIFFAFICGACGGYTNLFLKGVAEIVKNLLNGAI